MYSVLILAFLFWFVNIYPKCMYKRHLISKFQVLHEGSKYIASAVEHPVCSSFKMYSILILVSPLWFAASNPKCICNSRLFLNFQVLREGSSFVASFVEHPVCSNFKMYSVLILVVLFWFTNICPKFVYKKHLFSRFLVLCKRSSDITSSARRKLFYCFFRGAPYI